MKNIDALIPIFCSVYLFLMAQGVLPRKPAHPEKMEQWRRKFGGMITVLAPFLFLFGVASLLGAFNR